MKKTIKLFSCSILLVAMLFLVSACGGGSSSSDSSSNSAKSDWTVDVEGIGKVKGAISSDVGIAVIGVSEADSLGNQFVQKKPQGKFLIVEIAVTNNQKDAITVDANSFKLIDDKDREFTHSTEGQTAIQMSNRDAKGFLEKVNPGMTVKETIPFDVPKDATNFKLEAKGGMTGEKVMLPLQVQKAE